MGKKKTNEKPWTLTKTFFRVDIYQEISFFDEHASWGIEKTFPNYLLCHLLHLSQMDMKYQARESDRFSCFRKSNLPMLVLCDLIGNIHSVKIFSVGSKL